MLYEIYNGSLMTGPIGDMIACPTLKDSCFYSMFEVASSYLIVGTSY